MKVLLLRHGIAEDRLAYAATGESDLGRPLTPEGRRKLRRSAAALAELVPELALLATSPAERCRETASLVAKAFPASLAVSELTELAPDGSSAGVLRFLQNQKALAAVACVGHEPNLSQLAAALLTGEERPLLELRKGGACLIDLPGRIVPGAGLLLWHLTPRQLRMLA